MQMRTYLEPAREIPVKREVDVLVCGGGPAGFGASVAAARAGAKTMLVEQLSAIGGIATSGLMSHWTGNSEGPLLDELLERACDKENHGSDGRHASVSKKVINPEKTRQVMVDMLEEAGVTIQLYTTAVNVIKEGDCVRGVITESKSGREAIMAKVVIDATGDGDVAYLAGAEFVKGRPGDGLMQPVTVMFKVGGVDEARAIFPASFESYVEVENGEIQRLGREQLPHPAGHVLLYRSSLPGVVTVNMTNMTGIDGTRVEDLTRGDIACRRQIPVIVDFLRRNAPGYEACYLLASAPLLGVRETRHFVGLYTITKEDIETARIFEDWIATRCFFNFDIHGLTGPGLDPTGAQREFRQTKKYTVPYRSIVPKELDGLLLAGRNISGSHVAHSNYRAMPVMLNVGQGAGAAAAMCVRDSVQPRVMDVKKIQQILVSQGVTV